MAKKKIINMACTAREAEQIVEITKRALSDRTKTTRERIAIYKSVTKINPTYLRIEGDKATVKYMMDAIKAI